MSRTLKTATALALIAGSAALLTATRPGITTSNRLLPAKDGRVLVHTMTPKASWEGPYRWRIVIDGLDTLESHEPPLQYAETADGDTISLRTDQTDYYVGRERQFIDTVYYAAPTCVKYRVTVYPGNRPDSMYRTLNYCRALTKSEQARVDSFPSTHVWIAPCTAPADSGYVTLTESTSVRVGLWGRNRYSQRLQVVEGCEPLP